MMAIRYALLLSVSCLGLGSLANAGLIPDITPVGKNTFISTFDGIPRSSYTHLASQSKLLSASVIARRTSSDAAIHHNINGSPRRINSPRDDTDDLLDPTAAQGARSAILSPITPQLTDRVKLRQLASVCFITDAGNCRGDEYDYGGANTPDNSSGGTLGGGSSGGDNGNGDDPEWELDNKERCNKEGYVTTSCSSVQDSVNYCPYDNTYFERCECKPNLVTCTKPYYGVGESCGGKYASCQLDNPRACKEDGYTQTGSCNSVQNINKRCPYDANYFDKCVCRSDLYTCSSPLQGVGTVCGGKYASCQCPGSYQTCSCGAAAGASSCSWGGSTKYSSCKKCCSDTCPSGSKSVSCSSSQNKVKVSTTECGSACYSCKSSGTHVHTYQCPSGYAISSSLCSYGFDSASRIVVYCPCGKSSVTCRKCQSAPSSSSSGTGIPGFSSSSSSGSSGSAWPSSSSGGSSSSSSSSSSSGSGSHNHDFSCPSGFSYSCDYGYTETSYEMCACGSKGLKSCYKCKGSPYRNCCDDTGSYCGGAPSSEKESCLNYSGHSRCSSVVSGWLREGCSFVWCGGSLQSSISNSARFSCPN